MELRQIIRNVGNTLDENSPAILAGMGVLGVVSTGTLAARAGYLAGLELGEEAYKRGSEIVDPKEVFSITWKFYIPAVVSGAITITSIVLGNRISTQRNAALLGLYALADNALHEYQEKVAEIIGEKKEQKIRDEIAQDHLTNNPVDGKEVIFTGKGNYLFYDDLSGRYFRSDVEAIRHSVNDFNMWLLTDMYKPLNDFYEEIGLEPTEMGRNSGWDTEHGLLDIHFTAKIATDGEPCIVLNYRVQPRTL